MTSNPPDITDSRDEHIKQKLKSSPSSRKRALELFLLIWCGALNPKSLSTEAIEKWKKRKKKKKTREVEWALDRKSGPNTAVQTTVHTNSFTTHAHTFCETCYFDTDKGHEFKKLETKFKGTLTFDSRMSLKPTFSQLRELSWKYRTIRSSALNKNCAHVAYCVWGGEGRGGEGRMVIHATFFFRLCETFTNG